MEGESEMQAVEDAYRAALSGVAPDLLGKTTDRAFRQFVEDLLRLWTGSLKGLQKNKLNDWNNFETTISARSYSSRLETSYVVVTESVPFPMV